MEKTTVRIVQITDANRTAFLPLIPTALLRSQEMIFAAIDGSTGCGMVGYERFQERCVINWLWVAPQWRGQGIASMLLDRVCAVVSSTWTHVQLCYQAAPDHCAQLDRMLLRRGFVITAEEVLFCEVTGEALMNSPLMKHTRPQKNKGTRIRPLAKVEPHVLRACVVMNEERGNYQASRADYAGADTERSMALMVDTKVRGCVLIHPDGEPGCLRLDMFYLDENCSNMGISFLRACVAHSMELPDGIKRLRIMAPDQRTRKMAVTLLGDVTYQTRRVHDAQCYMGKPSDGR